jgi:homoserine kinase
MIRVTAPASSANLGPGFDVLALALDLRLTLEAEPADDWEVSGDDQTATVVASLGVAPMRLEISSDVPVGRGLGSSAALRAAVGAAALAAGGEVDRDELFRMVAAAEGHADNAAAAVYGGLVAAGVDGSIIRLGVHPSLLVVVAVPAYPLATGRARAVLGEEVSRRVAVDTAARVTALVEGLRTADRDALAAAAGDEMHETARRQLSPLTTELIATARAAGALHAAWSGAGPAVIAFATDATIDDVAAAMRAGIGDEGEVLEPDVDHLGVRVES